MTLPKIYIAETQLARAIALYLEGDDLISAATLAGASEEILGKLVRERRDSSALDESVQRLCELHEDIFHETTDPKVYVEVKSRARNEFKHIGSDQVTFDLHREASGLIRRAITNYRKLRPGNVRLSRSFERRFLARTRQQKCVLIADTCTTSPELRP